MKNQSIYLAFASIAALLTLIACGSGSDSISITNKPTDDFSAGSHEVTLNIEASGAWTISSSQTFVTFNPVNGSGNGSTTMRVAANEGSASRSATVTVASGSARDSFTLTQAASSIQVTGFPDDILTYQSQSVEFTVSSSGTWTISPAANWVSFDTSSGSGTAVVRMTVTANNGEARRETTVVISSNGEERSLPLVQERYYFIDDLVGKWYAYTVLSLLENSVWNYYSHIWEIDVERIPGSTTQARVYNIMFHAGEREDGSVYDDSHIVTIDNENQTIHIPVYEAEYIRYTNTTGTTWAYMRSDTFCDNVNNDYTGPISAEELVFENDFIATIEDNDGNPLELPLTWVSLGINGSECVGSGLILFSTYWQREPFPEEAPGKKGMPGNLQKFGSKKALTNKQIVPALALRK